MSQKDIEFLLLTFFFAFILMLPLWLKLTSDWDKFIKMKEMDNEPN